MTKAKRYLLCLLILILCISLVSCGFAQYIKYETPDEPEPDFDDLLAQMFHTIDTFSLLDICHESHLAEYKAALLDARNELNECKSVAELKVAWEKHSVEIIRVALHSHFNMDDYRDAEQLALEKLLVSYTQSIIDAKDKAAMELLFQDFEIELHSRRILRRRAFASERGVNG